MKLRINFEAHSVSEIQSASCMVYALVAHNHAKVGFAVKEVISDARKYGIKTPRLFDVERLIMD